MSVSFGSGDYYNYNNKQVKVPYRPEEEQPKEEIIIPFRAEETPDNAEDNDDVYTITTGHGSEGTVSYDLAQGPSISIQPYNFETTIENDNNTTKISVGPEFKVAGFGTKPISPLNILSKDGATSITTGVSVSGETKVGASGSNASAYGSLNLNLGYQYVDPYSQNKDDVEDVLDLDPSGHTLAYDVEGRVGCDITPDENNSVRVFAFGRTQGYSGQMTRSVTDIDELAATVGEPKVQSKESNVVQSFGLGAEYIRKLNKGEVSVSAQAGIGFRDFENFTPALPGNLNHIKDGATAPFGSVTVSFKF